MAAALMLSSRHHPTETKKAFVLKPHHERILEALFKYHFLTVEQVTRLFYSRGSMTTVRSLLSKLAQAYGQYRPWQHAL